jgi:hypothetical protein
LQTCAEFIEAFQIEDFMLSPSSRLAGSGQAKSKYVNKEAYVLIGRMRAIFCFSEP